MAKETSEAEVKMDSDAIQKATERAMAPYHTALGSFIYQYSSLETVVNALLISAYGVSHEVGQALFSGIRINQAKSFIDRILDATKRAGFKDRLKPYFDQINLITSMRDEILHYGAQYDHLLDEFILSNQRAAHVETRLRRFRVTATMLDDMAHDTTKALCGIIYEMSAHLAEPDAVAFLQGYISQPWRYKPPPLIPLARESP